MESESKKSLAEANSQGEHKPEATDRQSQAPTINQKETDSKAQQIQPIATVEEAKRPAEQTPLEKHASIQKSPELRKQERIQGKKKRMLFKRLFSKTGVVKPSSLKAKLNHYWFEYSRVLHLTRKPTRQEYKELAIMVVIGTLIIGGIGFVVQVFFQYI